MDDATITFIVLGGTVALFVWNRLPLGAVAVGSALALSAAGVIEADEAFAGFGDPTVVFIASLFVVAEALDATGVATWASRRLVRAAGGSETRLVAGLFALSAALSAILTPNGAIAALLPMTVLVAVRLGRAPSALLMPMAFAGYAGALLVLMGSPVNVLAADEAAAQDAGRFGFFEFALVGVPLTLGTIVIALRLGPRLLPDRTPGELSVDLSGHARTLMAAYALDRDELARHEVPDALFTRRTGVAEVVVPPRSPLIGERFFPGMVTPSGDLLVLAVQRQGDDTGPGEIELAAGDVLLLEGSWDALDRRLDEEVLVVGAPDAIRRQVVPLGVGARRAIGIVLALVAALASGAVPPAVAGALAAMAVVSLGVLKVEQAYRAVSWTAVILIAGVIPVSVALQETGAADDIAGVLLDVVGDAGPRLLLVALFAVAAVLSIAVSNTATALILIPVGVSAAETLGISAEPVLMSLVVGCSASFMTPISTPGNLMIMGPGGYRFGDYWPFGLPMLGLFFLVAVFWVPVVWPF
jgi:di/tricarboxylate transporter